MDTGQIRAFFERRQEAWNSQDPEALMAGYHPDAVIESPMFGVVRGVAAIEDQYRTFFRTFPDFTFNKEDLVVETHRVALTARCTATHTGELMGLAGTGRRVLISAALIFHLDDEGRIVHERRFYDFTGFLMQIGILKGKLR